VSGSGSEATMPLSNSQSRLPIPSWRPRPTLFAVRMALKPACCAALDAVVRQVRLSPPFGWR